MNSFSWIGRKSKPTPLSDLDSLHHQQQQQDQQSHPIHPFLPIHENEFMPAITQITSTNVITNVGIELLDFEHSQHRIDEQSATEGDC